MSIRAVILGLVISALLAMFSYYNEFYLQLTPLVGNHFPIAIFGGVLLIMITINPLLGLLGKRWPLRRDELAVTLVISLAACSVPGSGLMRLWPTTLANPMEMYGNKTGWQEDQLLNYVPDNLLPNQGQVKGDDATTVIGGFVTGRNKAENEPDYSLWHMPFRLGDVPWFGWRQALASWVPLVVTCFIGVIALSVVLHRQWSQHERLRYPIAQVASTLTQGDEEHLLGPIYRNRLFWLGLIAVALIHMANGFTAWDWFNLQIDRNFPLHQIIYQKYPEFNAASNMWGAFNWNIFFSVIGIAYFLASDVGLSLGISKILGLFVMVALIEAGVAVTEGTYVTGTPGAWMTFGAYAGIGLMILYTGRNYFIRLFKAAILFRRDKEVEPAGIWGTRIFWLCLVAMIFILRYVMEVNFVLAIPAVLSLFLLYVVMARISAETGLFFIQSSWMPLAIMVGLFGATALGPQQYSVLGLMSVILAGDPRETLMPFVVNGLKICEKAKVPRGRASLGAGAGFLLALAIALPGALWLHYDRGSSRDNWGAVTVPEQLYNGLSREVTSLKNQQRLEEVTGLGEMGHLRLMQMDPTFMWAVGIGLALVLGMSFMRLRYAWWPLHPVLFLVIWPNPLNQFAFSFLLGWLIKQMVTKIGGIQAYRHGKPLMIGVIAGDLLGGLFFVGGGVITHILDIKIAAPYNVLPV
jgi:hypothetical protein